MEKSTDSINCAKQLIKELDLHDVTLRLVKTLAWPLEEAENQVERYKNFLFLIYKYGDKDKAKESLVIPTVKIDDVWHNHILYTEAYTQECQRIFGFYLHHHPAPHTDDAVAQQKTHELMKQCMLKTAILYEAEFGESYFETQLIFDL